MAKRRRAADDADAALAAARVECRDECGNYFEADDPHSARAAALTLLPTHPDAARAALESAAAASESNSTGSPDAALDAWLARFLPDASRTLTLQNFALTGRGLGATAAIAAGDVVLRVPLSLVLTAATLPSHPILDEWHSDLRLAAALLLEPTLRPGGPWAEYTPLLPPAPPSALHWTPSQRDRLPLLRCIDHDDVVVIV